MPRINVLPKEIAELIAAGEVVERPASVVKEMIENSIDASSKHITVEIQHGGVTFIRITDDGCGIEPDDVPLAFLRHATSKIKTGSDLDCIGTLGFRGEALAATSAVSKVEVFTKSALHPLGTHYKIEGGTEVLNEESGCPEGTTVIIRDLFYNTPARMKFLKKDSSEASAVSSVVERIALSHPEISFHFIKDGKQVVSTSGDGKLSSAVYSILGREFASSLVPVQSEINGINISGFTVKPVYCRPSRSSQFIFLNGRMIRSGTVMAAVENAYKNSAMVGKFPGFVLNIGLPAETVDVNVHPAKTEIRFSDEKRVFDAVYGAVKNALAAGDTRPHVQINSPVKGGGFAKMTTEQYRQEAMQISHNTPAERAYKPQIEKMSRFHEDNIPFFERDDVKKVLSKQQYEKPKQVLIEKDPEPEKVFKEDVPKEAETEIINNTCEKYDPKKEVRFIGEAFSTYIIVQQGDSIFLIDKHAAHERIIFNKLKKEQHNQAQPLLSPVTVRLDNSEYTAVINSIDYLEQAGFEIEDFGNSSVLVRAVPAVLTREDVSSVIEEAAASIITYGGLQLEALDKIYHSVSCKAAIKAGYVTSSTELEALAKKVLSENDIMYCPHGRPVAFEIKKKELEKQFGRIQ